MRFSAYDIVIGLEKYALLGLNGVTPFTFKVSAVYTLSYLACNPFTAGSQWINGRDYMSFATSGLIVLWPSKQSAHPFLLNVEELDMRWSSNVGHEMRSSVIQRWYKAFLDEMLL